MENTNTNYVETWMGIHESNHVFQTALNETIFAKMQKAVQDKHYPVHTSHTKTTTCYDILLVKKIHPETLVAEDIKAYQQRVLHVDTHAQYQTLSMEKKKISAVLFPSTCQLHRVVHAVHTSYRVSHRLFINFVTERETGSSEVCHRVYVNYNHGKDADQAEQLKKMEAITQLLVSTF